MTWLYADLLEEVIQQRTMGLFSQIELFPVAMTSAAAVGLKARSQALALTMRPRSGIGERA
jgi:hypothetical protein